jgi:hypothetical protein
MNGHDCHQEPAHQLISQLVEVSREQRAVRDSFLTLTESAEASGRSRWTLRSWLRRGLIGYVRVGERGWILIPSSELARVMTEGVRPATRKLSSGKDKIKAAQ